MCRECVRVVINIYNVIRVWISLVWSYWLKVLFGHYEPQTKARLIRLRFICRTDDFQVSQAVLLCLPVVVSMEIPLAAQNQHTHTHKVTAGIQCC